jgi:hypothetical protein
MLSGCEFSVCDMWRYMFALYVAEDVMASEIVSLVAMYGVLEHVALLWTDSVEEFVLFDRTTLQPDLPEGDLTVCKGMP